MPVFVLKFIFIFFACMIILIAWRFLDRKKSHRLTNTQRPEPRQNKIAQQEDPSEEHEFNYASQVHALMRHLGYELTEFGVEVTLKSASSGYSVEETVSHLAVVSFARDAKAADEIFDPELDAQLLPVGQCILENIKVFRDNGSMRDILWRNDSTAIYHLWAPSPERSSWIEKVLGDPVSGIKPVALNSVIPKLQNHT